jgi:hypothetical protein
MGGHRHNSSDEWSGANSRTRSLKAARWARLPGARFKEAIPPSTYRKMRWNFFRMHFHFLMPNDIPGEYDYPMIVCGPVSLADRIAEPAAAVRAAYGVEADVPQPATPAAAVV